MNDLISRQAAIDALKSQLSDWNDDYNIPVRKSIENIERLPSARSTDADIQKMQDIEQAMLEKAYDCGKQDAAKWIPCSERLPEEDHWLGGSGRQFSDEVLVSVANYDDEDIWTYISQTIDGEWALELPSHCKIIAWMPLPEPYQEESNG